MPTDDPFMPQQENAFAANPEQYNASDIIIGRIGANVVAGLTGTGTVGSQAWITSVQTNTPSQSFAGVIHEIIAFDRKLNEHERQEVYAYLSRKYGVTMESRLPDTFVTSHPSAAAIGLNYWNIEHHPNTKGLDTIPAGISFSGITISDFMRLPDTIYNSAVTVLADGTVLGSDTYSTL